MPFINIIGGGGAERAGGVQLEVYLLVSALKAAAPKTCQKRAIIAGDNHSTCQPFKYSICHCFHSSSCHSFASAHSSHSSHSAFLNLGTALGKLSSALAGKMFMLRNGKSWLSLGSCIPPFCCPMTAVVCFSRNLPRRLRGVSDCYFSL